MICVEDSEGMDTLDVNVILKQERALEIILSISFQTLFLDFSLNKSQYMKATKQELF